MQELRNAFVDRFAVAQYPELSKQVAFVDGVSDAGLVMANKLGHTPLDLRTAQIDEALRQIALGRRVGAVLGRGELDKAMEPYSVGNFEDLDAGMVVRLGNGVGMNVQAAFENGTMVERTPRGNAEAVRIWQDLIILALLQAVGTIDQRDANNNPAVLDDNAVKSGGKKKFNWDRNQVDEAANPRGDMPEAAQKMAEVYRGKKVAVIGAGKIGEEVIRNSPFLKDADVHVYDPFNKEQINGSKVADSLEEALDGAELVLLHLSGNEELIGEKELNLLKDGAMICNMARGKIINPRALFEVIKSGKVFGAGLDTHYAEGKKLDGVDGGGETLQDYAVRLRAHGRVIATNHSAASEVEAQRINAEDGVRAVADWINLGETTTPVNAPYVKFPLDGGFVQRGDERIITLGNGSPRVAIETIHDGDVAGLMSDVMGRIEQALGGGRLNRVTGVLRSVTVGGHRNAIDFSVVDLPTSIEDVTRVLRGIHHAAMSVQGVTGARVFHPEKKAA